MNNKEFAKVLLIEATELLTEAGARQKYLKLLGEKQDKIRDEKEANLKKLENEPMKRENYGKNPIKSYVDTAKMTLKDKKLEKDNEKIEKEAKKYSARVTPDYISATFEDKHVSNGPWVSNLRDKRAKEEFNNDFGSKKSNNSKLHDRINKRAERSKSQNESIAVLLTEAALLLNNED